MCPPEEPGKQSRCFDFWARKAVAEHPSATAGRLLKEAGQSWATAEALAEAGHSCGFEAGQSCGFGQRWTKAVALAVTLAEAGTPARAATGSARRRCRRGANRFDHFQVDHYQVDYFQVDNFQVDH